MGKSANDTQVSGSHYRSKAIQPWDYIVSNNLGYLEGNIIKYVSRYKEKGTPRADWTSCWSLFRKPHFVVMM
jgi:hypothetical protein